MFAGYNLSAGLHWARKCSACALTSFANAGLSVRNAKIPPRIRQPLQTERIVLKMPVTFASEAKRKQKNETSATIEDGVDAPVLKPGVNLLMTKITNLI